MNAEEKIAEQNNKELMFANFHEFANLSAASFKP